MDKVIILIVIIIILAGVFFWAWQSGFFLKGASVSVTPTPLPAGIVLFYGQGCPHCADVETFIKANNIDQKLKITRLEVWYNKNNAALLAQVATQKCGITGNSVGVPFLYDGNGKCYIGEVDVPNFLKNAAGIK
ncbi:MAG: hypothetical protein ABSF55_02130 [Candidatus Staskawiczbacteria bacterium]|jgi:glutaredoxin